ncbi:hypothetical protein E2C01_057936 [Portunus trituberculatus]|uniref:Uncharacterized protein n=1 Tax=Portunus trituberculatus TaxID=210409 RepID=A0A5B7GUU7_PORTR|nr:hypothetical protein [Portunus trituberculatus]
MYACVCECLCGAVKASTRALHPHRDAFRKSCNTWQDVHWEEEPRKATTTTSIRLYEMQAERSYILPAPSPAPHDPLVPSISLYRSFTPLVCRGGFCIPRTPPVALFTSGSA